MVAKLEQLPVLSDSAKFGPKPMSPTVFLGIIRIYDVAIMVLTGAATHLTLVMPRSDIWEETLVEYVVGIVMSGVVGALVFHAFGVYSLNQLASRRIPVLRAFAAWGVTIAVLLFLAFAMKISAIFSRLWFFCWFASVISLIGVGHHVAQILWRRWLEDGRMGARTVILGAGPLGQRLAAHLKVAHDPRIRLLGFIDDRTSRVPALIEGLPLLGDTSQLIQLVRRSLIDQIIIALPWSADQRLQQIIRALAIAPVQIRLAPDLVGYSFTGRSFTNLAGLPMLHMLDRPISEWSYVLKSIEDFVLSTLLLLLAAPAMLLIALAIKLDSRGPILFRQRRLGFNDSEFEVLKFRTMYVERADPIGLTQTTRNDPRVTPVGKFLRKFSLDELPQLLNVIRGDMSIVGPRPHSSNTLAEGKPFERVVDLYAARHRVKPGITGWAQIHGWRGETDTVEKIQKRVEYDLYYIDNWSLWMDIVVLLRTAGVVIKTTNAY